MSDDEITDEDFKNNGTKKRALRGAVRKGISAILKKLNSFWK